MGELNSNKDSLKLGPIVIEELKEADIEQLEPILREHVRHYQTGEVMNKEVEDIISYMRGKTDEYGRNRKYFVARDSRGKILGCMGYTNPEPDLIRYYGTTPEESMELVNAFVSTAVFRGGGVGNKLFMAVCEAAKQDGKKKLLLSSGPRYKDSWGFYDKVCDSRGVLLVDKFGQGRHAQTWIKSL